LKVSDKGIMAFAGCIRGAIAFGLAISIPSAVATNRSVLISSTLVLVFFTTIVFGAVMPTVVKYFKKEEEKNLNYINSINNENNEEAIETYSLQRYESTASRER
jgi:sodium/hydrogen exchanger-like protein 3